MPNLSRRDLILYILGSVLMAAALIEWPWAGGIGKALTALGAALLAIARPGAASDWMTAAAKDPKVEAMHSDGAGSIVVKLRALVLILCFGSVVLQGCSWSLERAKAQSTAGGASAPSARCIQLDSSRSWWGAIAAGGIVAAGSSGVASIPAEGRWQTAAQGTVVGAAVLAGVAKYVADARADAWARECTGAK